jgi:hypothetical protein
VRIARDELRRIRELTRSIDALQRELATLVAAVAPPLLDKRGCGVLTAAKLIGEIAGIPRFTSDAKLARLAGSAPIPASSGRTTRHRLDRGGNRQLNCALHRLAVTKGRLDPDTAACLARKHAEGKSRRSAPLPQTPPRPPRLAPVAATRRHRRKSVAVGTACAAALAAWTGASAIDTTDSAPARDDHDGRGPPARNVVCSSATAWALARQKWAGLRISEHGVWRVPAVSSSTPVPSASR